MLDYIGLLEQGNEELVLKITLKTMSPVTDEAHRPDSPGKHSRDGNAG